jgi:hypothetical protein
VYLHGGRQTHTTAAKVGAPDIECRTCEEFGWSGEKRQFTIFVRIVCAVRVQARFKRFAGLILFVSCLRNHTCTYRLCDGMIDITKKSV